MAGKRDRPKAITRATLRDRVNDGVLRVTEQISVKGKERVNVVDRKGRPRTLTIASEGGGR